MSNSTSDSLHTNETGSVRTTRTAGTSDELSHLKHELLRAEVRLAKARTTVVTAEIDIKVLNARLKALAK